MKDDTPLLLDMLLVAADAQSFTASLDWPAFVANRLH